MGGMEPRRIESTIRLPEPVWRKLRMISEAIALRQGGRPSLSATVAQLIVEADIPKSAPSPEAA